MKEILIDKYLNGETSLAEEQELLHLLQTAPPTTLSDDERTILTMLSHQEISINSVSSIKSTPSNNDDIFTEDFTEEYDRIVANRKRRIWLKYTKIAAAVALIAIVGTVGIVRSTKSTENIAVAYVYGTETTDEELVMAMMQNTMSEMMSCSTTDEKLHELFNPE